MSVSPIQPSGAGSSPPAPPSTEKWMQSLSTFLKEIGATEAASNVSSAVYFDSCRRQAEKRSAECAFKASEESHKRARKEMEDKHAAEMSALKLELEKERAAAESMKLEMQVEENRQVEDEGHLLGKIDKCEKEIDKWKKEVVRLQQKMEDNKNRANKHIIKAYEDGVEFGKKEVMKRLSAYAESQSDGQ